MCYSIVMQYVTCVILFAFLAVAPMPRQTTDSPTHANQAGKGKSKSSHHQAIAPTPAGQIVSSGTKNYDRASIATDHKDGSIKIVELPPIHIEKDWMDSCGIWIFNFLLVAVGFLQFFILWKQSRIMKDHAVHLNSLAMATKQNGDALINGARAWLMVDIEWQDGKHILESNEGEGTEKTTIFAECRCRNEGKSFAQITEKGYVCKIISTDMPKMLPQEPDFSDIDLFHHACEYTAPNSAAEPYKLEITSDGRRKHNRAMVLYGRVKYRDVYGKDYETRFGYFITGMGNLERMAAESYPEYNSHT